MKKIFIFFTVISTTFFLYSCQTVTKKIDESITNEEKKLSKWINKPESELKVVFGRPDKIEFTENRSRYYIYITEKIKIKCERKFEINSKNMIVGFSSKNCF